MTGRSFANRVCLLCAFVAVVLMPTGPSSAEQQAIFDDAHDMQIPDEDGVLHTDPSVANGDVRKVVYVHGTRNVVVKVKFFELKRSHWRSLVWVTVLDLTDHTRDIKLVWRQTPNGRIERLLITDEDYNKVLCPRSRRIDFRHDRLRIVLSRRCFTDPRRLQFGSWYAREREPVPVYDDPHDAITHPSPVVSRWLRSG